MGFPEQHQEPDRLLIERFRRGDREAFDKIVARYRLDVYRIARRMTGTHEDADDVAQETFLRAYGALAGFRGESALKTWLCRIALNLSINLGRSSTASRLEERDLERLPENAESAQPGGDDLLIEGERRLEVRSAVDRLAPRQRQVVILRIYEEMKFGEIASLLQCPLGTVKANFFHAMNNLKRHLA
jgi:RNA polymerase sigma-70 factor (ECF subfamily)